MKKINRKGYTAPIVITVLLILYFLLYFSFLVAVLPGIWKWFFAVLPLVFSVFLIFVCISRIKEIKDGENDDLSQY